VNKNVESEKALETCGSYGKFNCFLVIRRFSKTKKKKFLRKNMIYQKLPFLKKR